MVLEEPTAGAVPPSRAEELEFDLAIMLDGFEALLTR
jgi:hypothetical protein